MFGGLVFLGRREVCTKAAFSMSKLFCRWTIREQSSLIDLLITVKFTPFTLGSRLPKYYSRLGELEHDLLIQYLTYLFRPFLEYTT